jgi:tripartite ATP-independent transporter DctP family solute receptor
MRYLEGRKDTMHRRLTSILAPVVVGTLFTLTLIACGTASAATFPKTNIRFAHTGVPGIPFHEGVERFAQLLKERTGGAVTVQIFPASQLGSEKDFVEQVKTGVIEMALTGPMNIAVYDGWGPVGVLAMPYIIQGNTEEELGRKLVKLTRSPLFVTEIGEKAATASNIRCVDMGWWFGERHLTTSKKQVTKPEDVKGLKIRTMDTPVAKSAMAALGAATVPMAVAELYTALQMGVVDGQENPFNIIYNRKFHEVQKYLALTGHMAMNLVIIIHEKFYQKLPPELQQVLVKAAMDAGDYQSDLTLKVNKKNLQDLKDKGMVVTEVNRAEFAKATKDAWKEFESLFGKGMYEKIVQEAAKY